MKEDYLVLAPGPVNLHPDVQQALALPMIHHRTPEFDAIFKRVLDKLKTIFKTSGPVFSLTSTGSGGMEALITNLMQPGDCVLGIDSGKFGERWCEMVPVFGGSLIREKIKWGESVSVEQIRQKLKLHPEVRTVMTQACETSTATYHPIEAIGKMLHSEFPEVLFLVDGITALGAMPLPMDDWFIDGLVGGSQKAFMLPTGMSFVGLSERAFEIAKKNKTPRFYFDLAREHQANSKGESLFSSNVLLLRALDVVLKQIESTGLDHLFKVIHSRAELTRNLAKGLGVSLYSKSPSDSVTAYLLPPGIDSAKIRTELEATHHITIMGGQDEAKGRILRIGHMGYITQDHLILLFTRLRDSLQKHGVQTSLSDSEIEQRVRAEVLV